jgi:prepilin-type N-terminal cleavage/methylation domain-containing protein
VGEMMKKKRICRAGFSLPELLIAVAVMGMLMAAAFGVLSTSIRSFQNTADQGANVQLSRSALNDISNEIRNATAVTVVTPSSITYTVPTDVLPLNTPNRSIALNTNSIIITYNSAAGNTVSTRSIGQGRINSLQIVRNARVFTITITLQSNAFAGSIATPVSTVVTMLNP